MPKFHEVFGLNSERLKDIDSKAFCSAICPYTAAKCDGGGNRHQTKIRIIPNSPLRDIFDADIEFVVPAVCSIDHGRDKWVVCPRRLMGFKSDEKYVLSENMSLQDHERHVLAEAGLLPGILYGVWSEIYLQYKIEDVEIDYHFDFVVAPLQTNVSLKKLAEKFNATPYDINILEKNSKIIKNIKSENKDITLKFAPDLESPIILEVMTASTSGSNTTIGTNISSAFTNLMTGKLYQGPGINKRQVWGRMATQLFAKSALAEFWDGKTYWVVQDELLKNIELTTKLSLSNQSNSSSGTINFISLKFEDSSKNDINHHMILDRVSRVDSGIEFSGDGTCADILLPKVFPPKLSLLQAMLRRNVSALIRL